MENPDTMPNPGGRPSPAACPATGLLPTLAAALALVATAAPVPADAADGTDVHAAGRHFTLEVLPLLKAKCFACHGDDPDKIKGELNLLTRDGMLAGGESSDQVLVPGDPEASDLFISVTWEDEDLEMPPKENDRLDAGQIEVLRKWIADGAHWPDEQTQQAFKEEEWSIEETEDGVIVQTSGGLADEWTYRRYQPDEIWAFRPVEKPEVPAAGGGSPNTNPIDGFIGAKQAAAGVAAAPPASPRQLVRRATLDLTGLPPTPAEIADFERASAGDPEAAWTALVDRLLASPRYGERWAQHWLDVARYADTGGMSNDYERSNAWRYRDYVIRSLNGDKPYDRFVVEQLAGDELADASVRERNGGDEEKVRAARLSGDYTPEESEWIVATGFLRMGPWDNAMVKAPEARQMYLDDVVNAVGQTFLSTTMRCVKCHDHKFDPIPTRDYYRMYAAFAGTQMAERKAPFTGEENLAGFEGGRALTEHLLAFAREEKGRIKDKQETAAKAWFAERDKEYIPEGKRNDLPDEEKPPRHVGLDHVEQGQLKVREQDEWIWNRRLERYQPMAQAVYNGPDGGLAWNGARKLRINEKPDPAWRPQSTIFTGGALEAPGEPVGPGVLSALGVPVPGAPEDKPYTLPEELEGRRLALAQWITDPRNPLTARSIVNRVWQHHFGRPIAGNPNNFGAKGAKPTHPQLLDWLAADFVEGGWTLKRLHRQIMTSEAYRMSTGHPDLERLRNDDPNNDLLAYFQPRRISAEELRDGLLAITGELNRDAGGLPAMPEINMEVALAPRMIQFSLAPAYQPSPKPELRNRRSVYAYRVRGLADPFLEVFNQPTPNDSCESRNAAPVTPQVFTLLNSDVMVDRSVALARRVEAESETGTGAGAEGAAQVRRAFELVLGRAPDETELERLAKFLGDMREYHAGRQPEPAEYPTQITRSLVEEFSGEPFEYEEILPAFDGYQPDTKPADVGPDTRALADVCLVLFNSNEFNYVY